MALPKPIGGNVKIFFGHFLCHGGPLKWHKKNLGKCQQKNFGAQKTRFLGLSWASCGTIQPTSNWNFFLVKTFQYTSILKINQEKFGVLTVWVPIKFSKNGFFTIKQNWKPLYRRQFLSWPKLFLVIFKVIWDFINIHKKSWEKSPKTTLWGKNPYFGALSWPSYSDLQPTCDWKVFCSKCFSRDHNLMLCQKTFGFMVISGFISHLKYAQLWGMGK